MNDRNQIVDEPRREPPAADLPAPRHMTGRYHAFRAGMVALVIAVVTFTVLAIWNRFEEEQKAKRAAGLVQAVLNADIAQIPSIVGQMAEYRQWADPLLQEENSKASDKSRQKLHTSLALLPVDASQALYLKDRLLDAEAGEVAIIRDALLPYKDQLVGELCAVLETPKKGKESQHLWPVHKPWRQRLLWRKADKQGFVGQDHERREHWPLPTSRFPGWITFVRWITSPRLSFKSLFSRSPVTFRLERGVIFRRPIPCLSSNQTPLRFATSWKRWAREIGRRWMNSWLDTGRSCVLSLRSA